MNDQNPFKKLSSKEIYQNKWITVTEDQVQRPDGSPGIFGVVAENLETVPTEQDQNEIITPLLIPLEEAVRMVETGKITHGASCVAILLVARRSLEIA